MASCYAGLLNRELHFLTGPSFCETNAGMESYHEAAGVGIQGRRLVERKIV